MIHKETCEYQLWKKWVSEKNLTLFEMLHEMTFVHLFLLVKYQSLPPLWAFIISVPSFKKKQKNKLTWAISCSNKSLMNLHHDAPNSHVLAINLTEFLVHVLSIASYIIADSESAKHAWKGHTLSIENFLYLLTK